MKPMKWDGMGWAEEGKKVVGIRTLDTIDG